MTQQQIGDEVGVARQTITAVELGKYSPTLKLAFRIANAFNVTLDEIITYYPLNIKFKKRKKK